MKTLIGIVCGVVAVELLLAVYKVPIADLPLIIAVSFVALAFLVLAKIHFATLADRRHERETYAGMQRSYLNERSVANGHATQLPQFDPTFQLMQAGFQMLAESQQQTNSLLNHLVQNQMQQPGLVRYNEPMNIDYWIEGEE